MKKWLTILLTILLGVFCFGLPQAFSWNDHIIHVSYNIDCSGYTVALWTKAHSGYTLDVDMVLQSGGLGYFEEIHYTKTFYSKSRITL